MKINQLVFFLVYIIRTLSITMLKRLARNIDPLICLLLVVMDGVAGIIKDQITQNKVGSFVPAMTAKLHVVDGIHTRMGASDNIQQGRTTFMEELNEASHIVHNCTSNSLVIMDELGRGTTLMMEFQLPMLLCIISWSKTDLWFYLSPTILRLLISGNHFLILSGCTMCNNPPFYR